MERFILEAALEGLEARKARIEGKIEKVSAILPSNWMVIKSGKPLISSHTFSKLRSRWEKITPAPKAKGKKRTMSSAGRKAVADAQRKRWAAFHKAQRKAGK